MFSLGKIPYSFFVWNIFFMEMVLLEIEAKLGNIGHLGIIYKYHIKVGLYLTPILCCIYYK